MKKLNLYLTDPQYAALQALQQHSDLPMAEVVRRALDLYFSLYPLGIDGETLPARTPLPPLPTCASPGCLAAAAYQCWVDEAPPWFLCQGHYHVTPIGPTVMVRALRDAEAPPGPPRA